MSSHDLPRLLEDRTPQVTRHERIARRLTAIGNSTFETLYNKYYSSRVELWNIDGWEVSDAQLTIDALGDQAILSFALNTKLGNLLNELRPGTIPVEDLATPVTYGVQTGRIVLDVNGVYPGPVVS